MNAAKPIKNIFQKNPETGHNNSVNVLRLIRNGEIHGRLATYNYAWLEINQAFEAHLHSDSIEYFLIIEGLGELSLSAKNSDFEKYSLKPGDFITVLPQVRHSIKNTGDDKLIFITLRVEIKSKN